jgi:hypothetical protein
VNTNTIESQQVHSGIVSTASLQRSHKDRQRRPAEQMRRNGERPPESKSHRNQDSHCLSEDIEEEIHLSNAPEGNFGQIFSPKKNQMAGVKEQGKRIDVVI